MARKARAEVEGGLYHEPDPVFEFLSYGIIAPGYPGVEDDDFKSRHFCAAAEFRAPAATNVTIARIRFRIIRARAIGSIPTQWWVILRLAVPD